MDRAVLLDMVRTLGEEFRRRGLRAHLAPLRVYWLALHHGLVHAEGHALELNLSEETVVEWFKLLRLAPYQHAYPVRPVGSACPSCPAEEATEVTAERTFPEGRKMQCLACRSAWLELTPTTQLRRGSDGPVRH